MIKLDNATKTINKKTVLDHISYEFEDGKIYGLYGINGSGKTMLLRAVAGLLLLNSGTIEIDNQILNKDIDFPNSIGIIIENMEMLGEYDAFTNLEIISDIKKVVSKDDINNVLDKVGLKQFEKLKVRKYSLGMKQRLNIAQAIMEKPKYLLLDEPFNALDDSGRSMLYSILKEEKDNGTTIIIAHHYREELLKVCDVVLEIKDGKIM
ncbi:MAG: ABC transporter ATP-binding protein [Coprobacillus cateniformis]|uniref:ATP-binding cassette domain-containing protein n=1 Tax=Longibaculum muris TaxID=1796628 RepID=UPI003AB3F2C7|nr:ABC transporter ATP-binding protein [Coprobacillus cateniformis]